MNKLLFFIFILASCQSYNPNDPMNVLTRYANSNEVTITDLTTFHKLEDIAYSKIEEHFRSGKDFAKGREMFPVHIEGPVFSGHDGLIKFATYWISCRTRMIIEFDDDNTVKTVNYYMYNDNDILIPITQNDYWRKVEKIPMPIQKNTQRGCSGLNTESKTDTP